MKHSRTVVTQKSIDPETENDPTYLAIMRGLEDIKHGRIFVWHRRTK